MNPWNHVGFWSWWWRIMNAEEKKLKKEEEEEDIFTQMEVSNKS